MGSVKEANIGKHLNLKGISGGAGPQPPRGALRGPEEASLGEALVLLIEQNPIVFGSVVGPTLATTTTAYHGTSTEPSYGGSGQSSTFSQARDVF